MGGKEEDNFLMLSGIQHYEFCKRQWALIHVEQQWAENVRTLEGHQLHQRADQPFLKEKRGNKLIVRAMPIRSTELKISGICDVVEFIKDDQGIEIFGHSGKYAVYPVEYKRGKLKVNDADVLQLTAQAICLEEMLLYEIKRGYIYYHETRRRFEVSITRQYKDKVKRIVEEMHDYYSKKHTPKVKTGPFCRHCSLQHICLPKLMNKRSVKSYIEGKIKE